MTTCLDCGDVIPTPSRCVECERKRQQRRNADPKRQGYKNPEYLAQPKEGICWLCGLPIEPGTGTRDHLDPLAGDYRAVKALPAHRSCNSSRGARAIIRLKDLLDH